METVEQKQKVFEHRIELKVDDLQIDCGTLQEDVKNQIKAHEEVTT